MPETNSEHFLVTLARESITSFYVNGQYITPPTEIPEPYRRKAGVFVSLHKEGELRGCIGTIFAQTGSVVEEVIVNAVSSATRDPRFNPVNRMEIPDLSYSVDVLGELEPVNSITELDPRKYGVVVSAGEKHGVLLPDLEGIDTAEVQVAIASQKAGIDLKEPVTLYRFVVDRYGKK